ncbi:hypothetical protein Mgra_00004293 [Meloidogyne graminicola]|uniref:Protein kinase domain-containing protein n=1 Tax=Meloidogyne graminicola TaxID=189291 RepID=A0A8S9ZSY1_9BILA|nr:hypothetical protein Mgra_00004293 [Meloidogyne graminicola]
MDFKPQNLLYVKDKSNKLILKAIDFGGSAFLINSEGNKINQVDIPKPTSSRYFVPPEINGQYIFSIYDKIKNSRKNEYPLEKRCIDNNGRIKLFATTGTDGWEFGIMILQIILLKETAITYLGNPIDWKNDIIETLLRINVFTLK